VLVLYNADSTDGFAIASHYADVHPGVQLLGLTGVSTAEQITADQYITTILGPVRAALTPTTDVIVTTKGMPLRIAVTETIPLGSPPTYTTPPTPANPNQQVRQISGSSWKVYSSLESELAAIDRIGSTDPQYLTQSAYMMGDQSYTQPGHFTLNPYWNATTSPNHPSFSHANTGTRLTARLDGFTVDDVTASIDRAQNAFIGPQNSSAGPLHFLVDNDPTKSYAVVMSNLVNNVLQFNGMPVTYDNTTGFVSSTTGPLMGYVSAGANQASTPPYVPPDPEDPEVIPGSYIINGLNISPADGAVFHTWESYNAETFVAQGNHGNQGLIGEWLAAGGTVATGHVQEPGGSWATVANEDKMFLALLNGKTWAEAAWSATRQLSYVNTVIGDPLMIWRTLLAGDVTMDGVVNMADLTAMGANWGSTVPAGGNGWYSGDLNGDGIVNVLDLAIMGDTWGQVSSWAGSASGSGFGGPGSGELAPFNEQSIPEPSSWILLAAGIGSLFGYAYRRRPRRGFVSRESHCTESRGESSPTLL
jgi:hypothetical protein